MKQYMNICEKCGNTFVSENDTRLCKSCFDEIRKAISFFDELLKKRDKL